MSDRPDLEAIRGRVAQATQGPWEDNVIESCGSRGWYGFPVGPRQDYPQYDGKALDPDTRQRVDQAHSDSVLIAAAPTDLVALCDYAERLEGEVVRLREALRTIEDRVNAIGKAALSTPEEVVGWADSLGLVATEALGYWRAGE
jgi:hypothetical protein